MEQGQIQPGKPSKLGFVVRKRSAQIVMERIIVNIVFVEFGTGPIACETNAYRQWPDRVPLDIYPHLSTELVYTVNFNIFRDWFKIRIVK